MKALTLTQPWATLVAIGAKRIETRSFTTRYRGPLAIHAAKGFPKWAREFTTDPACYEAIRHFSSGAATGLKCGTLAYPLGMVLATCKLIDCVQMREMHYVDGLPAGIIGKYTEMLVGNSEREFGDYSVGRYAWILDNVSPLPEPIAAKGMLGLWEWYR